MKARRSSTALVASLLAAASLAIAVTGGSGVVMPTRVTVSVTDPDLSWSPYNWHLDAAGSRRTNNGGAYLKLAFTGTTLALGIDTSRLRDVPADTVALDTYIDGAATPLRSTLADIRHGQLTLTKTLPPGTHYAVVYSSHWDIGHGFDRWTGPAESLAITEVSVIGQVIPLTGTPIAPSRKRIIIYGDSITEGYSLDADEDSYAGDLGRLLGVDYAQIGFGSLGWLNPGAGVSVPFYEPAAVATGTWENYWSGTSRLHVPDDPASGYLDGAPDLVLQNLGINDYNAGWSASQVRAAVFHWLTDERAAAGPRARIGVIVPFNFGAPVGHLGEYRTALLAGVSDYEASAPADKAIFTVDLGQAGYAVVKANSRDGLHPNARGSAILAAELAKVIAPELAGSQ